MISFAIFLLVLAVLGTVMGAFKVSNYVVTKTDARYGDQKTANIKQIVRSSAVFILACVISIIQPIEVQVIDGGSVGLKIDRIGDNKGIPVAQPCKGWVYYNSWVTDVVEYSIKQNHVAYEPFVVTTKGGFPLTVQPSFNYALKPEKAAELYINLLKGSDFKSIENSFLNTATNLSLNNASNKYAIDSIFNNKEGYNRAVSQEINRELSSYFYVTQINPGTVAPPELKEVISAKTNAIQKQQQAELDKLTAQAEAETKIATARGDSAALVIAAQADAEAIKQKQREITPNYIEFIKWSNWDGKLPTTTLGGGTNVLLNK